MPPVYRSQRRFSPFKILLWIVPLILVVGLAGFYQVGKSWLECTKEEPIDVVYTWVNGSDPKFIKDLEKYLTEEGGQPTDVSRQRFDDKDELRFSLRSLEKFAPWVNHVYIVTNGQVPNWLNMEYEKVTVVTHDEIFTNTTVLPTFSSPAIEQHLHRIPGLSKRFIYFNDDIFLGSPIYREDFYVSHRGFSIYLAYPLPPCSADCQWNFVGDGNCDPVCLTEDCQLDGGDCDKLKKESFDDSPPVPEYDEKPVAKLSNYSRFMEILQRAAAQPLSDGVENNNGNGFSDEMVVNAVEDHNNNYLLLDKLFRSRSGFSWPPENWETNSSAVDTYAGSLQSTNRMLNRVYDFTLRFVPSHAPFMVDVEIMEGFQQKFKEETSATGARRFRDVEDVQYAFGYFFYLYHETVNASAADIFDEFDTDQTGLWSLNEIYTLSTRLFGVPIPKSQKDDFLAKLVDCSKLFPDLPKLSKELVTNCAVTSTFLTNILGQRNKYDYELHEDKRTVYFIMLQSNASLVEHQFEIIRQTPKKFVCLNDNLDPKRTHENWIVRGLLQKLYFSMFPLRSKFELPYWAPHRFYYRHQYLEEAKKQEWFKIIKFSIVFVGIFVVSYKYLPHFYKKMVGNVVRVLFKVYRLITRRHF